MHIWTTEHVNILQGFNTTLGSCDPHLGTSFWGVKCGGSGDIAGVNRGGSSAEPVIEPTVEGSCSQPLTLSSSE